MNELMIFKGHEVEVIELDNKLLFNPYHVGGCLDLAESSVRNYLSAMNQKQALLVKNSDVRNKDFRKLNNAGEKFITESGVYKLVFKSHKPNAEEFTDWITDEVLPTLRKTGKYEMEKKQEKPKKKNLSSTNMMIKTVSDIFRNAGVDPIFIAAETKRLYKEEADIDIQIPLITDASMPKLYDCTEMAKELGILSNTGNPHNKAISAIIGKLNIEESEIITTAFSRKGHDDVTTQYKPSVVDKVKQWLSDNSYPDKIPYVDSKGNYKTYKVSYQCVEVA